jgi:hypothetical protein
MALSRKRKKELDKLRSSAAELWGDQKDVLEHAGSVLREAGHHAAEFGREEVAPRLADAADSAKSRLNNDVLPAVSSAGGSAAASVATLLEVAKDPRVKAAISKVGKTGSDLGAKVGVTPKKSAGPGRYILIVVGLVAVVGIAYAAWQTLRADDELWVSDDTDETAATTPED